MAGATGLPSVDVVICTYTEERWELLLDVIASVREQSLQPQQVIVVVDHNQDLYKRLISSAVDVVLVENMAPSGLSGARNTGIGLARADVVAFLDDDAEADGRWLERLAAFYDDPDVLAVGGRIEPVWADGRPGHFAEELDWIVGCTYRGMPKVAAQVRNMIGANMSFRRDVLEHLGGFNTALGRVGTLPLGCEETELCIRAAIQDANGRVVYEPAALVRHHVPAARGTFRYMLSRAWSEGISKAQVSRLSGRIHALAPEQRYVRLVLPRAVLRGLREWRQGKDRNGLRLAAAILAVLATTASGYGRGRFVHRPSAVAAASSQPDFRYSQVRGQTHEEVT